MQLAKIYEQVRDLELVEKRAVEVHLIDVVFKTEQTQVWQQRLEALLGPAVKAAGAEVSTLAMSITQSLGGIRAEQTLFYKEFEGYAVVAVFWPWQSGKCVTCKVLRARAVPMAVEG